MREDGASCAVLFDDQCYDDNVPCASVRRMTVIEEMRAQKVRAAQFVGHRSSGGGPHAGVCKSA